MDSTPQQPWGPECTRLVAEFNEMSVEAFRQEWGEGEDISIAMMQMQSTRDDIQLDIGPRAVYLVENATGLVYKISSGGRISYHKCVGHVASINGKELFRQQWW
ncbi:MAG: hypothetical protein HYZ81_11240 [Nitrospinae bacterium]|nr:hypothetical protein [Nitrospinota bacterium]